MKQICLIIPLTLILLHFYSCSGWYQATAPAGTPFHWSLMIHPQGHREVRLVALTRNIVPESLAWADVLLSALRICFQHALEVDDLVVILEMPGLGAEKYRISYVDYASFVHQPQKTENILRYLIIEDCPLSPTLP